MAGVTNQRSCVATLATKVYTASHSTRGCSIGLIGHVLSNDQDRSLSSVGKCNRDILVAPL
jgi:hypothetical protein